MLEHVHRKLQKYLDGIQAKGFVCVLPGTLRLGGSMQAVLRELQVLVHKAAVKILISKQVRHAALEAAQANSIARQRSDSVVARTSSSCSEQSSAA